MILLWIWQEVTGLIWIWERIELIIKALQNYWQNFPSPGKKKKSCNLELISSTWIVLFFWILLEEPSPFPGVATCWWMTEWLLVTEIYCFMVLLVTGSFSLAVERAWCDLRGGGMCWEGGLVLGLILKFKVSPFNSLPIQDLMPVLQDHEGFGCRQHIYSFSDISKQTLKQMINSEGKRERERENE